MLREAYRDILHTARRFARSEADARDLVQDVLEIALSNGVDDWSSPERRAWLRGVVRKRAAFVVRGQVRRRRRELLVAGDVKGGGEARAWRWQPRFLQSLPRSLRAVATLASVEMSAAEVRWLLQLTDTALRQRLSALRRVLRGHDTPPTEPAAEPSGAFGAQRAQVLSLLRRRGGRAVATQDPDGHVLFLKVHPHKAEPHGN